MISVKIFKFYPVFLLISTFRKDSYTHFELVQVSIKPLSKLGVDATMYIGLRDHRLKSYKDSILAMVQSNVYNFLIYFDYCPIYLVNLQISNFQILWI